MEITSFSSRLRWIGPACGIALAFTGALLPVSAAPDTSWLQWGGPRRNFTVETSGLASSWPSSGPRKVWSRTLGEGHSAIVVENGRLYTMYRPLGLLSMLRRSQQETITAIDAATGTTVWEHTFDSPTSGLNFEFGAGPHSTPLVVGGRVYAVGTLKQLVAVDKQTGKLAWSHDLMKEYGAPQEGRGYAPSPIQYRDNILVPAGGPGQSLMAFNLQTGALAWKNGNYAIAPASPLLITVDGEEQLVMFGGDEVLGIDPANGATLWSHPHKTDYGLNIATPVWLTGNRLLISSAYNNGTRLLKLSRANGKTAVAEQWYQNRMRVHIGSVIALGDLAVGSSGDFGPCPTVGIDLASGRILWQDRSFARSTFLHADGKLIVLDEDGTLGLATASASGFKVLTKASLLSNKAWTPPALVGTTLYVRDRKQLMALELGGS